MEDKGKLSADAHLRTSLYPVFGDDLLSEGYIAAAPVLNCHVTGVCENLLCNPMGNVNISWMPLN